MVAEFLVQWQVQYIEHLGETGPLSQGVQAGRQALRILHVHGMKVRRKSHRGLK
jgi:hypothetical protein